MIYKFPQELCNQSISTILDYYHLSKTNKYKFVLNASLNDTKINANTIINYGDEVVVDEKLIKQNSYIPYKKKLNIIYEDEYIVIVYKPILMLTHPDGFRQDTMINAISNYFKNSTNIYEHIHRLDYETSGMLLVGKSLLSISYLSYLMASKKIEKEYVCLCEGKFKHQTGCVDIGIARNRHDNTQRASKDGKDAKTLYEVLEYKDGFSKVKCQIIGGRTHQIRVHMAYILHPVVGDKLYNENVDDSRLMLEFRKVSFVHPFTLKTVTYKIDDEF